ncbi:MAG TPA: cytochrome c biogenesis heme-transporting ATPase CcmA [Burkholderiales bacterium]|nr:cytochrome c biogenesis heme-transporting ATPase CcmA [Burkholderiales bacterium]
MLEANELECERSGRTLFRGLSFALRGGELLRIAGPNGSGKTSLLRILCGLLTPSRGEVRWRGSPITGLREEYSRHLVYLGHAPAVKEELTPAENLDFTCRLAGVQAHKEALTWALNAFAVPDVPVRKLSQGQRRRAALARLLMSESMRLWLLDEPFAALDVGSVTYVEELVSRHLAAGGSVVYTTHQASALDAKARIVEFAA